MIHYRGVAITQHLSGWYSALTTLGFVKADSLEGIKKLIDKTDSQTR